MTDNTTARESDDQATLDRYRAQVESAEEQTRRLYAENAELRRLIREARAILTDVSRNTDNACLSASALLAGYPGVV